MTIKKIDKLNALIDKVKGATFGERLKKARELIEEEEKDGSEKD
ncbi:MAG: hypothetical protein SCJ93_04480 [Bacillota bacterium]|nr:hypothetical protein [Bacillota bacterium]